MISPKRILLVKLRHHGDVLLTTPLIDALTHYFPDSTIDVLIYRETLDMLRSNPHIAHCFTIDRQWKKQGQRTRICEEIKLLRALRARHYDTLIHLTESWRGIGLAHTLGTVQRLAFDYPRRQSWRWRTSFNARIPLPQTPKHNVELQLSILRAWNIDVDAAQFPLRFNVLPESDNAVQQKLTAIGWQQEPFVLIHPGARWFFKCWEDASFAQVIDALRARGWSIVLTGAPTESEQTMANNILAQVQSGRNNIYSLVGQLSLMELAAAIARARFFIGVDSVPMHLAAALQTPGIALFGPSKIHEWSPWQAPITVFNAADWGELPHPDSIDTSTATRYLSAIPAEEVIRCVVKRLENVEK
jgi:lipopolysaccharide heptosyltransferase III, putative